MNPQDGLQPYYCYQQRKINHKNKKFIDSIALLTVEQRFAFDVKCFSSFRAMLTMNANSNGNLKNELLSVERAVLF